MKNKKIEQNQNAHHFEKAIATILGEASQFKSIASKLVFNHQKSELE